MSNELNFNDFLEVIDLSATSKYIKNINIKLMKSSYYKKDLILIFDNIVNTLDNIDLIIKSDVEDNEDIKLKTITQLITIHQQIIEYRMSEELTEDEIKAINKLAIIYPIFIFGNALENEKIENNQSI